MEEIVVISKDELSSRQLGADISLILKTGDLLALSGDLGVGKTVFARGLIQCLLQDENQDVQSPTYTICNDYRTDPAVFHFDLYRLSDPQEADELGIEEALDEGVCIVEWPENGFEILPAGTVLVRISEIDENRREFTFTGNGELLHRIGRTLEIRKFLDENGFDGAARTRSSGDASARRYENVLAKDGSNYLLMDSPEVPDGPPVRDGKPYSQIAHLAENVRAFVAIDNLLIDHNLAAPEIPAADLSAGLILVQYLGSGKIIDQNKHPIPDRYMASVECLATLHGHSVPASLKLPGNSDYVIPSYDHGAMMIEVELLLDWYLPEFGPDSDQTKQKNEFYQIWETLISALESQEKTLVLRDFHSPNIIWREGKSGVDRVGLIDFQDALIGPTAYDVASLAQDARVDVSQALEESLVARYIEMRKSRSSDFDVELFKLGYAIMAAQRATKILGIFCRLNRRDGKPAYMAHIPRIRDYLKRSLDHPIMVRYGEWLESVNDL